LASSENFTNDAATAAASFPKSGAAPTNSASQATGTISYDATSRGYTLTVGSRTLAFLPADLDATQSSSTLAVYVKRNGSTTDSLTLTKAGASGRFTYEYVGAAFWQRSIESATSTGPASWIEGSSR